MRRRERDRPLAAMPLWIAACIAAMSAAIIGVDAGVTAPALVTSTNTFDFYHHARLDRRERRDRHAVGARHQRGRGGRAGITRDRRPRRGEDGTDRERHRRVQGHVQLVGYEAGARPGHGVLRGGGGGLHPAGGTATKKNASSVKVIADDTPPALVTLIPNLECDVNGVMTVDAATPKPAKSSLLPLTPNSQASPQASRTNDAESAALITDAIDNGEDLSARSGGWSCAGSSTRASRGSPITPSPSSRPRCHITIHPSPSVTPPAASPGASAARGDDGERVQDVRTDGVDAGERSDHLAAVAVGIAGE